MLWLGYAGMPRRIQDYPQGYTGWHSVASLGHTFVLLGLVFFLLLVGHAFYFKRPAGGRHSGMPFVVTRLAFVTLDRSYAAKALRQRQVIGIRDVREYLLDLD
jgi:heme/copper-type cytochrome/quinol oxidase subunit 1